GGGAATGGAATGGATASGDIATAGSKATGGAAGNPGIAAAGSSNFVTGCIVPLYSDPGEAPWAAIVAAKHAHPRVPMIAILDPDDGPGNVKSAAYVTGIATLNATGIRSIGYVYTSYGGRAAATVRADIDRWYSFYPSIDGIFFDEAANSAGGDGYYRELAAYVKSLGMTLTVANPGTDTSAAYIDAVDVSFIYESAGLPSTAMLTGWKSKYTRSRVGVIPYAANLDENWVRAARDSVGYIYVTNDDLPNPWDTLPAYFADLLAQLE
ncbi:MAG TPA: spherulation-specific family 4 protein, partial [Polyangiaceae bacterium]